MTQEELTDDYFSTGHAMFGPAKKDEDPGHPSADLTGRHPTDGDLRARGCRIEHRRKGKEPVWSHPDWGKQTQSDMLRLVGLRKELKGGLGK